MGELEVLPPRRVVVSALPLRRRQLALLAAQLGSRFELVDIRRAPRDAAVVLCPPCSPQTVGRLRGAFPSARVVAIELHDRDAGLHIDGPVGRILAGGASGYVVASSGSALAAHLDAVHDGALNAPATSELPSPTVDDLVMQQLDALARRRTSR